MSKLVQTKERIQAEDALLFHHILFTMYDVARYGIRGNTRKIYYHKVTKLSNIYGIKLGLGRAYGHKFVDVFLYELVWWDGVLEHDGTWEALAGDMYRRCANGEYQFL